jgi:tripartite ATP-independent transporter DctP family solute receptor
MLKKATLMATLALGAFACNSALAETWRLALEEVEDSVQDIYAQEFKRLVEKRTDGEVRVDIYPYDSLGTSPQLTELMRQGAVQLAFASPGHLAATIPETGVFTLHFLFSDDSAVNARVLADSATLSPLEKAYREQQLELLDVFSEGWVAWTANRAIETPEDMQGLKIRTMASPIVAEGYRAYGAETLPMPYASVYSGLQSGQADAQANPLFAIEEMDFHEVQSHLIQARPAPFITTLVASRDFYADLPQERRQLLAKVVDELRDDIAKQQAKLNAKSLEALEENEDIELTTLTDKQRQAFREKSLAVREAYVEQAGERGQRILDALEAELRAAEATGKKERED